MYDKYDMYVCIDNKKQHVSFSPIGFKKEEIRSLFSDL